MNFPEPASSGTTNLQSSGSGFASVTETTPITTAPEQAPGDIVSDAMKKSVMPVAIRTGKASPTAAAPWMRSTAHPAGISVSV